MSVDSEMLGNKGVKHSFEFEGKTYELSYLDKKIKGAFEKHLFKKAFEAIQILKEGMSPEEYEIRLEKLNSDYLLGEYSIVSKRGDKFLKEKSGMLFLAYLLIGCDEDVGLRILTSMGSEVSSLIRLVLQESLPSMKKEKDKDPPNAPVA